MIIKSAEFVKSAVKKSHYPPADLPEIAFAGRSNVGKSSLINVLVNRKRLVKTSSTPGRTQLINFFCINNEYSLVDLPGFGYAKVPVNIRKNWGVMVETYLSARENLLGVVLLMDIRRDSPVQGEIDRLHWLDNYHIPVIIVLTKADKLKKNKQNQQHKRIADILSLKADDILLFSAKTRMGREKIWERIGIPADIIKINPGMPSSVISSKYSLSNGQLINTLEASPNRAISLPH